MKLNFLLDFGLQFLIACLAALVILALLRPQSPPNIVAVDLEGYIDQLQQDWQAGKMDEPRLKKILGKIRKAIATIPRLCPNTVIVDDKVILAGDAVIYIDADDLKSLEGLSPNEQLLYLKSILRCK